MRILFIFVNFLVRVFVIFFSFQVQKKTAQILVCLLSVHSGKRVYAFWTRSPLRFCRCSKTKTPILWSSQRENVEQIHVFSNLFLFIFLCKRGHAQRGQSVSTDLYGSHSKMALRRLQQACVSLINSEICGRQHTSLICRNRGKRGNRA